ncbi:SNF related kinase b [Sardina pilchardus]|uniref:SNF related kinase b n=1 Tax=Sardina pilchardus TaxID=27697 RepID=UPI002E15B6B4
MSAPGTRDGTGGTGTGTGIGGIYELLGRTLGRGHFAVVHLARHIPTGQRVALKEIDKTRVTGAEPEGAGRLLQEVSCMKLLRHPGVVRLYEVIDTPTKLYLVLELAEGGDLYDLILRHEAGLGEAGARPLFAQVVRAIAYCHRMHVVHRDLKPENLLLFPKQGALKLTDFGFSKRFHPGTKLTTSCGSLAYSAPEVLLGEEYHAPAVDIWSLGVILYMLVCGVSPFQEANDSETLTRIMDCSYSVPSRISADCRDLISLMLQRDACCRATLEEIEGHRWLQGVVLPPQSAMATNPAMAPVTPHSLTASEHEAILQSMRHVASAAHITEALNADRYDHITATYYLLAERILRERQQDKDTNIRSISEPLTVIMPDDPVTLLTSCNRHGVSESGDLLNPRVPSLQQCHSSDIKLSQYGAGPPAENSSCPTSPDEPQPIKNVHALQQICEEEEEEEEDENDSGVYLAHTPHTQALPHTRAALTSHCPSPPTHEKPSDPTAEERGENTVKPNHTHTPKASDASDADRAHTRQDVDSLSPAPGTGAQVQPQGEAGLNKREAESGGGSGAPEFPEKNNNTPLPCKPLPSPRPAHKNHCVEEGPDAVETGRTPVSPEAERVEDDELHADRRLASRKPSESRRSSGKEVGPELWAKGRGVRLRERLLQFPLCEKALSLNINPAPKEKLLPFAQYNCCHVL